MYLVIGGSNQGKLAWSLQHFSLNKQQVLDAAMLDLQPGYLWTGEFVAPRYAAKLDTSGADRFTK